MTNGNDEAHRFVLDLVIRVWYPFRRSSFFESPLSLISSVFILYELGFQIGV